jgi:uncharacterized protein YcbK (DUF882 family)
MRSMSSINQKLAKLTGLLRATVLTSGVLLPLNSMSSVDERSLSFYHTHTHKTLEVTYAVGGEYVESALDEINDFLGDFRTGDAVVIDPVLLDIIYDVRASLGSNDTYEVISAYRSPKTNQMLRDASSGVAKKSQHLLGKAIDVRLRNVASNDLRDAALRMRRGGVGYYEKSNFVHMDTGRVRRW